MNDPANAPLGVADLDSLLDTATAWIAADAGYDIEIARVANGLLQCVQVDGQRTLLEIHQPLAVDEQMRHDAVKTGINLGLNGKMIHRAPRARRSCITKRRPPNPEVPF